MSILYPIVESEHGPLISYSNVTVYDVMGAHQKGRSCYDICKAYDLLPIQLESALEYISENRRVLESALNHLQKNGHLQKKGTFGIYT